MSKSEKSIFICCGFCYASEIFPLVEAFSYTDYHQKFHDRFHKATKSWFYCLVLSIIPLQFDFALKFLEDNYPKRIMIDKKTGLPKIDKKNHSIWLLGSKTDRNKIKENLRNRNIYFRILRETPFCRFVENYYNGKFYRSSKSEFRKMLASKLISLLAKKGYILDPITLIRIEEKKTNILLLILWTLDDFFSKTK
jgi:hypothetical protein